MSATRHGWGPSLAVVGVFLPVVLSLGAWALANSNQAAITNNAVTELKQAHEDDEKRIEKLEIQVAAQSCQRRDPR